MKKKSRVKVPVVMQMEALECGAAALAMILAYYGRWVALEQLRIDCGVSRDGSNAKNILIAARKYGLKATGYRIPPSSIREGGSFPCIIHWEYNHFVVLEGFKGEKAYLCDPARGNVVVSAKEFEKSYTGVAMVFEPTEQFEKGGKRKSTWDYAGERLKGAAGAVIFTTVMAILSYVFTIINPLIRENVIDEFLTGRKNEHFEVLMIFLILFAIVQIAAQWVNSVKSLKIDGKLAVNGSTSFLWKILMMPMEFFSQRTSGDLLMRLSTNEVIAKTMVNTLAPLYLNCIMMVFYLIIMVRKSMVLAAIGIITVVINVSITRAVSIKKENVTRGMLVDKGKLETATISGISMIETIKGSGAENGFFSKWSDIKAEYDDKELAALRINAYMGGIPTYIAALANHMVLFIGVYLTMKGEFTIGMISSFQGIMGNFMEPAQTIMNAGADLQEMRARMERIDDVMNYPDDECAVREFISPGDNHDKLSGNIEIKNVSFGYSRLSAPIIDDFSLKIEKGQRIAIVGSSGSGKSTISRLISGLYKPWGGEILFDGKRIEEIDKGVFTGSLAVVDQEITIFADTIENNIKMWDSSIEDFEVILAARDVQVHDDIMQKSGGYQHVLTEGGKDLSGGQRQRLEIARVLAMDPSVIILDEATSALDAKTEKDVIEAIKQRGITLIIIAHRVSTIKDCDNIIVLNKGKITESGTHAALLEQDGYYKQLVSSEGA